MNKQLLGILCISALMTACPGGEDSASKPQKQEDIDAPAKQDPAQNENPMAQAPKNIQNMMAGLQKMAANAANAETVDPLHFRDLYEVFPDKRGWEKGKSTGQTINMPYTFSQAEATYTKGSAKVKVNIIDGGWHPMMLAPYAMFLNAGFEKETQNGFEKTTTIAGHPGWEKWDSQSTKGTINLVIKERFLIQYEGKGLESLEDVRSLVEDSELDVLVKAAEKAEAEKKAASPQ